ncbi:MAG: MerR family transcriptional regulator [Gammaproteobacteria bacterium]|jgi:MerR family mercuric resistance operon transcriptional regulator|nr:MerR family transcriptional regulator [Gammaproteobacteria bacterium]NCF79970.1 MerR family transcriptional regulator [Pseudomonadota bacterium]
MNARFGIGALSEQTGCNIETIRYYEREGLLPNPPRTEGGHRVYDEEHLKRLTFIRRSRELGFTLEEVRGLLRMVDGGHYTCAQVKSLTLDHLEDVRGKLADLKKLEKVLKQLAGRCTGDETPDCPIVEALFE